jgi:hypothetical protein
MSETLSDLEARRRMLVVRSERLREDLADVYSEFEARLGGLDRIFAVARGIASPSILLSVGGLALALLRRARPFVWATRGVLLFSVARRVLTVVRALRASPRARR